MAELVQIISGQRACHLHGALNLFFPPALVTADHMRADAGLWPETSLSAPPP